MLDDSSICGLVEMDEGEYLNIDDKIKHLVVEIKNGMMRIQVDNGVTFVTTNYDYIDRLKSELSPRGTYELVTDDKDIMDKYGGLPPQCIKSTRKTGCGTGYGECCHML